MAVHLGIAGYRRGPRHRPRMAAAAGPEPAGPASESRVVRPKARFFSFTHSCHSHIYFIVIWSMLRARPCSCKRAFLCVAGCVACVLAPRVHDCMVCMRTRSSVCVGTVAGRAMQRTCAAIILLPGSEARASRRPAWPCWPPRMLGRKLRTRP